MAENQFVALLEKQRPQIEKELPDYLKERAEVFFANARAVRNDRNLEGCSDSSLLQCVFDAARRGLMIGGPEKHCAVVKFKTTAVLIVQWQGKAFLWTRAGAITKLNAQVVYEGDQFHIEAGDADRIVHIPDFETERSSVWLNKIENIRGAYAIARLTTGERVHSFVSRSQLVRTMEFVKRKNNGSLGFGWQDWLPEMCRKTAIHRLDGFIQAPPSPTAEQRDAWERNRQTIDAESTFLGDEPPDDPPVAEEPKSAKENTAQTSDKKTSAPQPQADGPISEEEADELFETATGNLNLRASQVFKIATEFGIDDGQLKKLKPSQVAAFTKRLHGEAQG